MKLTPGRSIMKRFNHLMYGLRRDYSLFYFDHLRDQCHQPNCVDNNMFLIQGVATHLCGSSESVAKYIFQVFIKIKIGPKKIWFSQKKFLDTRVTKILSTESVPPPEIGWESMGWQKRALFYISNICDEISLDNLELHYWPGCLI